MSRQWYVKGKGLAPARCVMTQTDYALIAIAVLPIVAVAFGFMLFC